MSEEILCEDVRGGLHRPRERRTERAISATVGIVHKLPTRLVYGKHALKRLCSADFLWDLVDCGYENVAFVVVVAVNVCEP